MGSFDKFLSAIGLKEKDVLPEYIDAFLKAQKLADKNLDKYVEKKLRESCVEIVLDMESGKILIKPLQAKLEPLLTAKILKLIRDKKKVNLFVLDAGSEDNL